MTISIEVSEWMNDEIARRAGSLDMLPPEYVQMVMREVCCAPGNAIHEIIVRYRELLTMYPIAEQKVKEEARNG